MRQKLPNRRNTWTQRVKITSPNGEMQTVYLSVGEYDNGLVGEIWVVVAKAGSFLRGSLDNLARMVSVSLQCGTPLEEVIGSLKGLSYPPEGKVEGSPFVQDCTSVADWIAKELEYAYITSRKSIPEKIMDLSSKGPEY